MLTSLNKKANIVNILTILLMLSFVLSGLYYAANNPRITGFAIRNPKVASEVTDSINEKGEANVIVVLKETSAEKKFNLAERKASIRQKQDSILNKLNYTEKLKLEKKAIAQSQSQNELVLSHKYSTINAFSGEINKDALQDLQNDPNVEKIIPVTKVYSSLVDSVPLINANAVWETNINGNSITGSGQTICIIDTGVDYNHSSLGGAWGDKVIGGYDFVNLDNDPMDDNGHGTHVAGIAAANGTVMGVAPGAGIIAIKALGSDGSGLDSDVLAGIDWCINNASLFNISVISMSLGGNDTYSQASCPSTMDSSLASAVSSGIAIFAASGNTATHTGITYPACSPYVISVGSSTKSDVLSTFTNTGDSLDVLAPGENIVSTSNSGGTATLSGTSMATPHAAGAAALIKQYEKELNNKQASFTEILSLLKRSNVTISGYPRINVMQSINNIARLNSADNSAKLSDVNVKFNSATNLENVSEAFLFSHNFIYMNSSSHPEYNKPSTITFSGLPFDKAPVIYKDGVICSSCSIVSYNSGNLSFSVTGFSNYTSGPNAQLLIYDQADPEGGSIDAILGNQIEFYANYTNITSGIPINTGNCAINFSDSSYTMEYNSSASLFELNRTFPSTGYRQYNVTCSDAAFETLNSTDDITILSASSTCNYPAANIDWNIYGSNVSICNGENIVLRNQSITLYDDSVLIINDTNLTFDAASSLNVKLFIYNDSKLELINSNLGGNITQIKSLQKSSSIILNSIINLTNAVSFEDNSTNILNQSQINTNLYFRGFSNSTVKNTILTNRTYFENGNFTIIILNSTFYDVQIGFGYTNQTVIFESPASNITHNITFYQITSKFYGDLVMPPNYHFNPTTVNTTRYYSVYVNYTNGSVAANKTVNLTDSTGNLLWNGTTDSNGFVYVPITFTAATAANQYNISVNPTQTVNLLSSTPVLFTLNSGILAPADPPSIDSIILNSTFGTNTTDENLTVYWTGTNNTINITDWRLNGNSIAVLNMPFEAGTSNSTFTKDYSTYNNNGNITNAVWLSDGGYIGGAYNFTTANAMIVAQNALNLATNNITITAWIKGENNIDQSGIVIARGGGTSASGLIVSGTNQLRMIWHNALFDTTTDLNITPNVWSFVAMAVNSTNVVLYLNNNTFTFTGTFSTVNFADPFTIGLDPYDTTNRRWLGAIDEVKIFNRTLSSQEIDALYNNGTDLMVSQELHTGDIWSAAITPNDGLPNTDGPTVLSNNVTILSPPASPNITSILLNSTFGTNTTGENLTVYWNGTNNAVNITDWRINTSTIAVLDVDFSPDGLNNITDYSPSHLTPVASGNVWCSNCGRHNSGAMTFPGGGGQFINTNYNADENLGQNWSYSFWFKYANDAADYYADIIGYNGGAGYRIERSANSDSWYVYDDFAGGYIATGIILSYDTWHNIVGGWNSTSFFLYVDNVSISMPSTRTGVNRNEQINFADVGFNRAVNSTFDSIVFYNRTLTRDEVTQLFEEDRSWDKVLNSIAVLNMPFEAGSSNETFTRDYSTYSNDGTVTNAVWNATSGVLGSGAYDFNGIDSYVLSPETISNQNITVLLFVKPNADQNQAGVFQIASVLSSGFPCILMQSFSGFLRFYVDSNYRQSISLPAEVWTQVGASYNGTAWNFYSNGNPAGSYTGGTANCPATGVYIGNGFNGYFNGTIDDVVIYNRTLSSQQINELYSNRTNFIASQELHIGDVWQAAVTPNDGLPNTDGPTVLSNRVTMLAPPSTCVDNDGDGFNSTSDCGIVDCDDNDPDVVPPASGYAISHSIVFCPGEYNMTDSINIASNDVRVMCNNTKITGGIISQILNSSFNGTTIENCVLANAIRGLYFYGNNGVIFNNTFINSSFTGIDTFGSNDSYLYNSFENNSNFAIFTSNSPAQNRSFIGNFVKNSGLGGIFDGNFPVDHSIYINNTIINTSRSGTNSIRACGFGHNVFVENKIYGGETGIVDNCASSSNDTISSNTIINSTVQAIFFGGGGGENITVSDNSIECFAGAGISTSGGAGVISSEIFNNTISICSAAIDASGNGIGNTLIYSNYLFNNTGAAINFSTGSRQNNTLRNNTFDGNNADIDTTLSLNNTFIQQFEGNEIKFDFKLLRINQVSNLFVNDSIVAVNTSAEPAMNISANVSIGVVSCSDSLFESPGFHTSIQDAQSDAVPYSGDPGICADNTRNFTTSHFSTIFESGVEIIPEVQNVLLNSTFGTNLTTENLTVYFNEVNATTNITDWRLDGNSVAVLNMPFEINSLTVKDYSSYENNGTVINAAFVPNGGVIGSAYEFNGAPISSPQSYINVSNSSSLKNMTEYTIEFWMKPTNTPSFGVIMRKTKPLSANPGFRIEYNSVLCPLDKIMFEAIRTDSSQDVICSDTAPNVNQWNLIDAMFNGSVIKMYINGALQSSTTPSDNTTMDNDEPLWIGACGACNPSGTIRSFNGTLDEVKIYNRALSLEEILLHNNTKYNILSSNETKIGNNWSVAVTPNDEIRDGDTVLSNNLEIRGVSCTDNDGDGFSPDGGPCGVIDCNDNDSSIIPPVGDYSINRSITFCPGEYDISSSINITKNNVAVSCDNTYIIADNSYEIISMNETRANISIKNCNLENGLFAIIDAPLGVQNSSFIGNTLINSSQTGIRLYYDGTNSIFSDNNWIENNTVINATVIGIQVIGQKNSTFVRNVVDNSAEGIMATGPSPDGTTVIGNTISNIRDMAISGTGGSQQNWTISNNYVSDSGNNAVALFGSSASGSRIINNTLIGSGNDIITFGSGPTDNIQIINNTIMNGQNSAIQLTSAGGTNYTIQNNIFRNITVNTGIAGFTGNAFENVFIINNSFTDVAFAAAYIFGNASVINNTILNGVSNAGIVLINSNNREISGNKVLNASGFGMFLSGNSDTIRNNFVNGSLFNGILTFAGNALIEGNHVENVLGAGLYASVGNETIRNNFIYNSSNPFGLGAYGPNEKVYNNTVLLAGSISLASGADNNSIENNTISNNTFYGIFLSGNNNIIKGNKINESSPAGIYLATTGNMLQNNQLSSNELDILDPNPVGTDTNTIIVGAGSNLLAFSSTYINVTDIDNIYINSSIAAVNTSVESSMNQSAQVSFAVSSCSLPLLESPGFHKTLTSALADNASNFTDYTGKTCTNNVMSFTANHFSTIFVNSTFVAPPVPAPHGGGGPSAAVVSCSPMLQCNAWSECTNGVQKRTCTDVNGCITPATDTRYCVITISSKPVQPANVSQPVNEIPKPTQPQPVVPAQKPNYNIVWQILLLLFVLILLAAAVTKADTFPIVLWKDERYVHRGDVYRAERLFDRVIKRFTRSKDRERRYVSDVERLSLELNDAEKESLIEKSAVQIQKQKNAEEQREKSAVQKFKLGSVKQIRVQKPAINLHEPRDAYKSKFLSELRRTRPERLSYSSGLKQYRKLLELYLSLSPKSRHESEAEFEEFKKSLLKGKDIKNKEEVFK